MIQCILILLLALFPSVVSAQAGEAFFERGVGAYRQGQYAEASAHWKACLDEPLAPGARGQVLYDLGNSSFRQGEALDAVGWYSAALRHLPRDRELWSNLELARAKAGLEPADRGNLRDTMERLLGAFRPSEARTFFALGLALVLLAALGEALRGGRLWARLFGLSWLLALGMVTPWLHWQSHQGGDPLMILAKPSVALRNEPRLELPSTGKLNAGSEVQRVDELPGWVRVRGGDGSLGWVQESAVFELEP